MLTLILVSVAVLAVASLVGVRARRPRLPDDLSSIGDPDAADTNRGPRPWGTSY